MATSSVRETNQNRGNEQDFCDYENEATYDTYTNNGVSVKYHVHGGSKHQIRTFSNSETALNSTPLFQIDGFCAIQNASKQIYAMSNSLDTLPTLRSSLDEVPVFSQDNRASLMRKEYAAWKQKSDSEKNDYRTPLQRRDDTIRQLKLEIKELREALDDKNRQLRDIASNQEGEFWNILKEKQSESLTLRQILDNLRDKQCHLNDMLDEKHWEFEKSKLELRKLKVEFEQQDAYHQEMYLKMYEKGIKAAKVEREDELGELAATSPNSVTNKELLDKLTSTQKELSKWQTIARKNSYDSAYKPETDSEAILKFMKDSMFHFLTDSENSQLHLRAMVRMLGFTDDEKRRIALIREKIQKTT